MNNKIDFSRMINSLQASFIAEKGISDFILAVTVSTLIGALFAILHRLYYENDDNVEESINRSLVLIAPSVTSIFWAIQFSLPLSLGLLGALSFVRYRSPIKKSEDIGFILAVIASSLGCSIYRFLFSITIVGIVGAITLVKRIMFKKGLKLVKDTATLVIEEDRTKIRATEVHKEIENSFKKNNLNYDLKNIISEDHTHKYYYQCKNIKDKDSFLNMINSLKHRDDILKLNMFFES